MPENSEAHSLKPAAHLRRHFLRVATAATVAAVLAPKEVLAEAISTNEQTPEFFATYMQRLLERNKKVQISKGVFRIGAMVKKLKSFPAKSSISDSLKEAPFFQPSQFTQKGLVEEIENPVIVEHQNEKYLAWNSVDQARSKEPIAIALDEENYGSIAKLEENQLKIFDKEHNIFQSTEMIVNGMAETNYNQKKEAEMFCKDKTGKLIPVMRSLTELNSK